MSDQEEANPIQHLKEAVEKNPKDTQAYLNLGQAFLKDLNGTEALEAFQKATRLQADNAEAYFGLAKAFDALQRYDEMLDAFKEACWLKPDWPEAHYNLGLGYMVVGLYEDALEPLKEAVKVKPDYAEAHRVLSLVFKLTSAFFNASISSLSTPSSRAIASISIIATPPCCAKTADEENRMAIRKAPIREGNLIFITQYTFVNSGRTTLTLIHYSHQSKKCDKPTTSLILSSPLEPCSIGPA